MSPPHGLKSQSVEVSGHNSHCSCLVTSTHTFLAGCDPLEPPENGEVSWTGLAAGDVATYVCNPGFELVGMRQRTCVTDSWSGEPPICRGMYIAMVTWQLYFFFLF